MTLQMTDRDVLLVVDVQNDFLPGGALAVPDGDLVIEPIRRLAPKFEHVVFTQDWHPADHHSFASTHPGAREFEEIEFYYGSQTLWPDHCVQDTEGADFASGIDLGRAELILRKGFRTTIDSYSAFYENDRRTPTGLAGYLRERRLDRIFIAGLAYDFCVSYSALDARRLGFTVYVVRDACRAIDLDGSAAAADREFSQAVVKLIETADIPG